MSERERFRTILQLLRVHGWLFSRSDSLDSLLYEDCSNDMHRGVIFELLERFKYFDDDDYRRGIEQIAADIKARAGSIDPARVVVAGMAMSSDPDSSHEVIYRLKSIFARMEWEPVLLSGCDRVVRRHKEVDGGFGAIFVVDEFVGSGSTLEGRFRTLVSRYKDSELDCPEVVFHAFAGMKKSINRLNGLGLNVSVVHLLDCAIDDGVFQGGAEAVRETVLEIGKKLSSECGDEIRDDLGYGGMQALYFRQDGNIPNNVLPVFWWPVYKDSSGRRVLFKRAGMGKA